MAKSKKRNTNWSTWKILRLFLLGLVFFILGMAIQDKNLSKLDKIAIKVNPLKDNKYLVDSKSIKEKIVSYLGQDLDLISIQNLDVHELELMIEKDNRIADAELYVDKHNKLNIDIEQKVPIVRIQTKEKPYYLDKNGAYIPTVKGVAVRVPLVTGKVMPYSESQIHKAGTKLNELLQLAKYVSEDKFLVPLCEQINIEENGEFVLVPKIARNEILFGSIKDMEDKFYRLKVYYNQGVKQVGLNKFDVLDLRYDDQVVGVKDKHN